MCRLERASEAEAGNNQDGASIVEYRICMCPQYHSVRTRIHVSKDQPDGTPADCEN